MNQNSRTAYQVAHSSELQGRVDVDVSAKESSCQSSVCRLKVGPITWNFLWCMSTDSVLTWRILPAYEQQNERCQISVASDEKQLSGNSRLIPQKYWKITLVNRTCSWSNFFYCCCCLWNSLHFMPEFWLTTYCERKWVSGLAWLQNLNW